MTPAKLGSYVTSAGLLGFALYHLSTGDYAGAATAVLAAFGLGTAANSGPAAPVGSWQNPIVHPPLKPRN